MDTLMRFWYKIKSNKTDSMSDKTSDPNNGLILNDVYVPVEVLADILAWVDSESLRCNCSRVCHTWYLILKDIVWRDKLKMLLKFNINDLPWQQCMQLCIKNPLDKNLLANAHGEHGVTGWEILSNGGDHWRVENPPTGSDPLPKSHFPNVTSCFATSYQSCSKSQQMDLCKLGLPNKFLDEMQPPIYVCDWYAGRFDCGCVYEMEVMLFDKNFEVIQEFKQRITVPQWEGTAWHKVEHTFRQYGPGVRHISFYHGGQDTQFWSGHYGSKMTGSVVKISSQCLKLTSASV